MRKLTLILLALTVALLGPAGAAQAKTKKSKPKTTYYLALGDSLTWGYQKDAAGTAFQSPNSYVKLLYKKAKKHNKKLKLVNLGCPGENLKTFADGGCVGQALSNPEQQRSQMDEALAFLKKHRKQTSFITLSMGANEFTPCAKPTGVDIDCALNGLASLKAKLPPVAKILRKAAGKKVKIATHTQYNPFLALILQGGSYADLGLASSELAKQANVAIKNSVFSSKFLVADVYSAFKSNDLTTMVPFNGGSFPLGVVKICELTQQCLPAPQGNIHPNDAGYALMAKTFAKVLKIK
jgi:lysophospholipase L1-like esterase